jgi:uncharacterized protein (DUF1778 family)
MASDIQDDELEQACVASVRYHALYVMLHTEVVVMYNAFYNKEITDKDGKRFMKILDAPRKPCSPCSC